jgi:hypothetical protein
MAHFYTNSLSKLNYKTKSKDMKVIGAQRNVQLKKMGKLEKRTICSFVGAA